MSNSVDVCLEAISVDWVIWVVEFLDVLVDVEFVLLLKLAEGLDILVEWLDGLGEGHLNGVIGIPKPSVLVWKH